MSLAQAVKKSMEQLISFPIAMAINVLDVEWIPYTVTCLLKGKNWKPNQYYIRAAQATCVIAPLETTYNTWDFYNNHMCCKRQLLWQG